MTNQNTTQLTEFVKARNAAIAIAIAAPLILLDQVIHIPLWVSIPSAAVAALGARYFYLKRIENIQFEESE